MRHMRYQPLSIPKQELTYRACKVPWSLRMLQSPNSLVARKCDFVLTGCFKSLQAHIRMFTLVADV